MLSTIGAGVSHVRACLHAKTICINIEYGTHGNPRHTLLYVSVRYVLIPHSSKPGAVFLFGVTVEWPQR